MAEKFLVKIRIKFLEIRIWEIINRRLGLIWVDLGQNWSKWVKNGQKLAKIHGRK